MDLDQYLAELRLELELVDETIRALERIAAGRGRGRGRPPGWLLSAKSERPDDEE